MACRLLFEIFWVDVVIFDNQHLAGSGIAFKGTAFAIRQVAKLLVSVF
jgi:hypothetical protein